MKNRSKKKKQREASKRNKLIDSLGDMVTWGFIALLWFICISYFFSEDFFGHEKQFGQTVGICLLFFTIVIATIVFVIMTWKKRRTTGLKTKTGKK